jgi:hypothetical protein
MSRIDLDRLARSLAPLATRRAVLGLAGSLFAGYGLASGDRATLGKRKKKCKKENQVRCGVNSIKLSDEKGCWHCCPPGSDVVCWRGNCCRSAVNHCCDNSPVCRANTAVPYCE